VVCTCRRNNIPTAKRKIEIIIKMKTRRCAVKSFLDLKENRLNPLLRLGPKIKPQVVIIPAIAAIQPPRDEVKYSMARNNINAKIDKKRFNLLGDCIRRTNAIGNTKFINAASIFGCWRKPPGNRNPKGGGEINESLMSHQVLNQIKAISRLKIEKRMAMPSIAFSHRMGAHPPSNLSMIKMKAMKIIKFVRFNSRA
jgi:hypothetical protein